MIADPVRLALAGLEYSLEHIEKFETLSHAFLASDIIQTTLVSEQIEEKIKYYGRAKVVDEIPLKFRFIFGDAIHNLRAPCDHLLNAFCRKFISNTARTDFPVYQLPGSSEVGFLKWRQMHKKLPSEVLDVFQSIQPFREYCGPRGAVSGEQHPLSILNSLWNLDKHETRIVVLSTNENVTITFNGFNAVSCSGSFSADSLTIIDQEGNPSPTMFDLNVEAKKEVVDGVDLFTFSMESNRDPYAVKFPVSLNMTIAKSAPAASGLAVYPILLELHTFVKDCIVAQLEPYL